MPARRNAGCFMKSAPATRTSAQLLPPLAQSMTRTGLPAYVEKELRAFIECGIAEFGFALAQCRLEQGRELRMARRVRFVGRSHVADLPIFDLVARLGREPCIHSRHVAPWRGAGRQRACPDAELSCIDPELARIRYRSACARYYAGDFSTLDLTGLLDEQTVGGGMISGRINRVLRPPARHVERDCIERFDPGFVFVRINAELEPAARFQAVGSERARIEID